MRHELKDLYAEFGPLLLFDASSETRWKTRTFNDFILDQGERAEAEAGYCTWLECEGIRQFMGNVELLVEEPPPAHARYAHQHAEGLWLHVPTGKLVLTGRAAVLAGKERAGESPRHHFDVPPGDYAVEAWAYVPHEERLEDEELPGAPPKPRWSGLILALGLLTALGTFVGLLAFVSFFVLRDWRLFGLVAAAVVGLWGVFFLVSRVTGWSRYRALQRENFRRTLEALPPIPDFTVCLRRVDAPPARGGGVSTARVSTADVSAATPR
ncbi:MAG: hypothetical protein AMXMBFR34_37100 [Myxococcaceae bacterium]